MEKYKQLHLFIPSISLTISISNCIVLELIIPIQNIHNDDCMTKYYAPIRIFDETRVNLKYKKVINYLVLFEVTNFEAQLVVAKNWTLSEILKIS